MNEPKCMLYFTERNDICSFGRDYSVMFTNFVIVANYLYVETTDTNIVKTARISFVIVILNNTTLYNIIYSQSPYTTLFSIHFASPF